MSERQTMFARSAGAPRLIEWTGERCVPWAPDVQVVYEHVHRYLWAAELVRGRRVLDLASGEGFGASILAQTASSVLGVDIDERSVEHASLNYVAPVVSFAVADARDLSAFDDASFDVVVAFEMIEHVDDQPRVIDEIARVLAPDGLLVMSTPDRRAYSEATGQDNPFHLHELARDEFVALATRKFGHVGIWGQRTITGSILTAAGGVESERAQTFFVERAGEEWRMAEGVSPLYMVMLASNAELPAVATDSTLGDCGLELLRAAERAAADEAASKLRDQLDREISQLRRAVADRTAERDAGLNQLSELRARGSRDAESIAFLEAELDLVRRQNLRIEASVTWQTFQRVRDKVFSVLGGAGSRRVRVLQGALRLVGPGLRRPTRAEPLSVASGDLQGAPEPEVSIVIPLYVGAELTRAALESIRANTDGVRYEVILVDDDADVATKVLLGQVNGARVITNEQNVGYQRSVERGVAEARGRWLVLCNNDIEVRPGWLEALLDCAESADDIAIVAPKYLYPDGRLAEAGGIIWSDGTGANYGRGDDPAGCRYQYRREIDYGSAAALMVKADFWREVGGFDERFLPMYYEDTDLCFQARQHGFRVMYEPRAEVIHVEGGTAGVDLNAGPKRYQTINWPKFVEKWRDVLEREHLENDPSSLWAAANRASGQKVLIVDHVVPMWDRDSGSLRMRRIIDALLALGCQVSLLPDSLVPTEPYTRELQRLGVQVIYGAQIHGELAAIGPTLELAILSRPQVASRWLDVVREYAPCATVAYDTVDLHWLREARRATSANGSDTTIGTQSAKARGLRELELALVRAADMTFVVSESERAQVNDDVPEAVVHVLPNANEIRLEVPPAEARDGILFVGGFHHAPNVDAALMLVREVMPRVWESLGETRVTIVGPDAPPDVQALALPPVEVTGWVEELDPLLDSARVLVAPLTYGAGMKGKITQALASGLPVVTTAVGAEGLDAVDGEHLLLGETAEELAERTVRVINDPDLWQRLSRAGQELSVRGWSQDVITERLGALLGRTTAPEPADASSAQTH